jgi:hypothetical protein
MAFGDRRNEAQTDIVGAKDIGPEAIAALHLTDSNPNGTEKFTPH